MHSMVVDLRSPREWRWKIQLFTSRLESVLGGRLVMVVALPSPSDTLYDSNVLVVLDELRPGDLEAVASLSPEGVSPLVVPEADRQAVEAFRSYEAPPGDWGEELDSFLSRLVERFGGRLVMVVALPSPSDTLYDSNVLVVLDELRPGDLEAVASLSPEGVSPLVVPEADRQAVEAFILVGGRRLWGRSADGSVGEG